MLFPIGSSGSADDGSATLLVDMIGEYVGSNKALEATLQGASIRSSCSANEQIAMECTTSGRPEQVADTVEALIVRLTNGIEQMDFVSPQPSCH